MPRALWLALAAALTAPPLWAEAPSTSLRPMPRPGAATIEMTTETGTKTGTETGTETGTPPEADLQSAIPALAASLRPLRRPEGLGAGGELASAPTPEPEPETGKKKKEKTSKKGSVCGDPAIKGEALAAIKGRVKGCGLDKPVRVTSISGIRLNQPATISCDTAAAFKTWIDKGMRPAMGKREVVEIRIAASYVCRSRNNKKGAKISEHGRGRAVDVAGFVFSDGSQWSVEQDYNKQLRRAHKAACGIFGTTLGPGSDGYHEDHLHFDIADHGNGAYCR